MGFWTGGVDRSVVRGVDLLEFSGKSTHGALIRMRMEYLNSNWRESECNCSAGGVSLTGSGRHGLVRHG